MKQIQIHPINSLEKLPDSLLIKIKNVLLDGDLIICPTESSYLLGCNIFDNKAIQSIYNIKNRQRTKPLPAIVANRDIAERLVVFNNLAEKLVEHFWPGPLTLVLPIKDKVVKHNYLPHKTLGIRVPAYPVLQEILNYTQLPIISTSANRSQASEPYSPTQLVYRKQKHTEIKLVLLAGDLPVNPPSTVIDISTNVPRLLREGAISFSEVNSILYSER